MDNKDELLDADGDIPDNDELEHPTAPSVVKALGFDPAELDEDDD
jgi:hypothetical protein